MTMQARANEDAFLKQIANSLIILGIAILCLQAPSGTCFCLPIGQVSLIDFILASGALAHLGVAISSWWRSSTSISAQARL